MGRPVRQETNADEVRNLAQLTEMEFAASFFLREERVAREEQR